MKISAIAFSAIPLIAAGSAALGRLYATAAHAMDVVEGRLATGEDKKTAVLDIVGQLVEDKEHFAHSKEDLASFIDDVKALYNVVHNGVNSDSSVSGVSPDNTDASV